MCVLHVVAHAEIFTYNTHTLINVCENVVLSHVRACVCGCVCATK